MLLNQGKAAAKLGVHRETLRRWKQDNKGPATLRVGKRHYYSAEVIEQWERALSRA